MVTLKLSIKKILWPLLSTLQFLPLLYTILILNHSFLIKWADAGIMDSDKKIRFRINGENVKKAEFEFLLKSLQFMEDTKIFYESDKGGVTECDALDSGGNKYRYEAEYGVSHEEYNLWQIPGEAAVEVVAPLKLLIQAPDSLTLTGIVKNLMDQDQYFLRFHGSLQPRILVMKSKETRENLVPTDSRDYTAYPGHASEGSFVSISAGDSLIFESKKFLKNENNSYRLEWDCFIFEDIPPGLYLVKIIWESKIDRWFDSGTNQWIVPGNIWLGDLESNEIEIVLP